MGYERPPALNNDSAEAHLMLAAVQYIDYLGSFPVSLFQYKYRYVIQILLCFILSESALYQTVKWTRLRCCVRKSCRYEPVDGEATILSG